MKALLVPIYKKGDQDDPKNMTNISPEPGEKIIEVGSRQVSSETYIPTIQCSWDSRKAKVLKAQY